MKALTNFLAVVIVLAVIAVTIVGGYYGMRYIWNVFMSLDIVVRVVLLTGIVTVLVAALIIASALKVAVQSVKRGHLFESRRALYATMIELYGCILDNYAEAKQSDLEKVIAQLKQLQPDFLLLGSKEVLDANAKLRAALKDKESTYDKLAALFDQLIRSLRRDLGHRPIYERSKVKLWPAVEGKESELHDIYLRMPKEVSNSTT